MRTVEVLNLSGKVRVNASRTYPRLYANTPAAVRSVRRRTERASLREIAERLALVLFGGWLGLVLTAALVGAWKVWP